MVTVPQLTAALEHLLTAEAEAVARSSGFVQRASKLSAPAFLQTLVFGWMADPDASVGQLVTMAGLRGVALTPQALEQRFTPRAVRLVEHVLARALALGVAADPVQVQLLNRFSAVWLQDSTVVPLPDAWGALFPSCGGSAGAPAAALKLQVGLDLLTGAVRGPVLQAGRDGDLPLADEHAQVHEGELRLQDRGYWSVGQFARWGEAGAYWISYYQTKTTLYDRRGRELDLLRVLRQARGSVDRPVLLSAKHRLRCRLLGVRVSPAVAAARRERLAEYERKQGRAATPLQVALTAWSVVVTNAPPEQLTRKQVLVLLRARWQLEVLFKVWKSVLGLGHSRSRKPARVLCEVLVKLLIGVLEHWVVLTDAWAVAERSLLKAATQLRVFAGMLAQAFGDRARLQACVGQMARLIARGCRVRKRKGNPSTAQLLVGCSARA
jgi:hypothetical protein